jgi:cytoskeleton protein RodZ
VFEIGYSLRSARERQGLGYPEIELATKIRAKYIRALEEEDFDSLPGDAYVRGFLRSYADYLGLDGDIYVDEYASRFHSTGYWSDEPEPRPARPRRTRRERTIERRAVVLALAGIAMLTALVFAAWRYGGATTNVPALQQGQSSRGVTLTGVGSGTYVVVRRASKSGRILFSGTIAHGHHEQFTGTRFYVFARRAGGVGIVRSPGVTIVRK